MAMKREHRPAEGLILLFVVLLLAAACGVGLLCIAVEEGAAARLQERKDEIYFLDTAFTLTNMGGFSSDDLTGIDPVGDYWNANHDGATSYDLMLVDSEGKWLDKNIDGFFPYVLDRVHIRWWNGYCYFTYVQTTLPVTFKYRVVVYDSEHPDGGGASRGSIGAPLSGGPVSDADLMALNLSISGKMLIYTGESSVENGRYLLEIIPDEAYGMDLSTLYGEEYGIVSSLQNNVEWRRDTKLVLLIAFPLLLALYWLLLPYWVYLDVRRRGMRAGMWTVIVFTGNLIGFLVYVFVARTRAKREASRQCSACGKTTLRAHPHCPWCGSLLARRCPVCGGEMQPEWTACPVCEREEKAAPMPCIFVPAVSPEPPAGEEKEPAIPPIFMDGSPFVK